MDFTILFQPVELTPSIVKLNAPFLCLKKPNINRLNEVNPYFLDGQNSNWNSGLKQIPN
jgi:hypothetical protein